MTPGKILVPVEGSRLDDQLMDLACYQAKRNHARLYVVHVIEVKRALPLEIDLPTEIEKGERILQKAEEAAHKWHQSIETEVLQARDAGTAIVEEAERRGIELIILGLRYRKRFDQFYLGSTVMHVLRNAPCGVLVYREPIHGDNGSERESHEGAKR